MLMPPHLSQLPRDALEDIEAWLRTWNPIQLASSAHEASGSATPQPRSERAVRFGRASGCLGSGMP